MHAVGITRFGGPDVLEAVALPVPEPGAGQVRVRVAAAAVNPADTVLRAGVHGVPYGDPPWVPGMDLAGTVEAAAPGTGWRVGERVMAAVSPAGRHGGAQASYVVVSPGALARVPGGIDLTEAATLPMNGLTARRALDLLALPAGGTLAVTGAAGAVGGYVVQLAAAEGLRVIADAAPADEELVRGLGAHVVVPRGPDVAAAIRGAVPGGTAALVDAAVMGGAVLPAVRDGGQVMAVRPFAGAPERGITVTVVHVDDYLQAGDKLAALADLAARGILTLRVADVLTAGCAAEAHRRLEAGGVRGRLVLSF
jgi:NADPH:quinone reductase-like Zn-dependent oxidoreductase